MPSHAFKQTTQRLICHINTHIHSRSFPSPTQPITIPRRTAQNLSTRYDRLATSIREKQAFSRIGEPETYARDPDSMRGESIQETRAIPIPGMVGGVKKPKMRTFRGFSVPVKPVPPGPDACAVCVYDLYQEAFEEYRDAMSSLRANLRAQGINEDEWPEDVKERKEGEGETSQDPLSELDVTMSAFAELEKRLREQKE